MTRIAIILAGGASRRMGGQDKAQVELKGTRLIDHVLTRLRPQVDAIAISGRNDYGTGLRVITDLEDGPKGPAAGLFAALRWLRLNAPDAEGFLSVPVDGPNLPADLYSRLAHSGAAIAADDTGLHPTFAYWPAARLEQVFQSLDIASSLSLHRLAEAACAGTVVWPGNGSFQNVNSPEDLAALSDNLSA